GPCTNSSDSAASTPKRWPGCKRHTNTSPACSPTGSSSHSPQAGLWGPDDGRLSRPVLRAAGGETPPADSPGCPLHFDQDARRPDLDILRARAEAEPAIRVDWPLRHPRYGCPGNVRPADGGPGAGQDLSAFPTGAAA